MIASVKIEHGHVNLTTPLLGVVCYPSARTRHSLKFDDSRFSRSRLIMGAKI